MTVLQKSNDIFINETERKPNLYAANVMIGVVAVIAIVCAMNEIGIFAVNKTLVRICLGVSLTQLILMQYIIHRPALMIHPASKYFIVTMILFLVLTVTVLLNIHAVLAFILPILLATQYHSKHISRMALIGSCFCCFAAPILSYFLGTWSLNFLTGYIQTFCKVTIEITPGTDISAAKAIEQIFLYWSLPQMMTIGAFGIFLFSVTNNGIKSVNNQIQIIDLSNDLNYQIQSVLSMQEKVLASMSDIIENRDIETGSHVRRTSEIVYLLMEAMRSDPNSGVTEEFCLDVIRSAPMHDLGKISVPDTILKKPGRLTAEEYEIVKKHPEKSAEIISKVLTGIENERLITIAKNIAKYHHEKMDGTGYPEHLKGKEIPLEARIMAIADVYDALVSERCYKAAMAFDEAFQTIEDSMGTHFDPDLNCYFLSCRQKIEEFYKSKLG